MAKPKSKSKKRTITPEDLLRFELISDPQISPDGEKILFSRKVIGEKNDYITNVWMLQTGRNPEPHQFTSGGKDSHARWSPDGSQIAFISKREESRPNVYLIPSSGGEATRLTDFPEGAIKNFRFSPDGTMLAVMYREAEPGWTEADKLKREETGASVPPRVIDDMYYRLDGDGYFNAQRFHLYLVDLETGRHQLLYDRDSAGWFTYDWSPDSRKLVIATNTSKNALLKFWKWDLVKVDVRTKKIRKIPDLPVGPKSNPRFSPDGTQIAFAAREGRECWGVRNTHLFVCDRDGKNIRNLSEGTDYCLNANTISDTAEASFDAHFFWSPDGSRLLMNLAWEGETHIASVPATGGKFALHTSGRKTITLGNASSDGQKLALTVSDQLSLPEVAVGEFAAPGGIGKLRVKPLSAFNQPLLDELELSPAEPHWIESSSGTKVHVWVMQPPHAKAGKKCPAVLEVHGGPHCQYGEAFFHEFQVLAAAGNVVVFSNPRGSKGYGEAHCTAIRGKWGQADWEDIQAVTAFMQRHPSIDKRKMGVMGGSYGGYMTNWAIGHTRDFAAAITDRCVSNLVSMVGSSDLPLVPGEYWDGNSWDSTDEIWEQSPLKHLGNVKTPTLIIHSEGDLRCNIEQSEQVFAALKLRGIPTRFVRYPASTSHGMSRSGPPDLRLHRLGQILDWWQRYLH